MANDNNNEDSGMDADNGTTSKHAPEDDENINSEQSGTGEAVDLSLKDHALTDERIENEEKKEPCQEEQRPPTVFDSMSHEEKRFFLSSAGISHFLQNTNRLFWINFLMGLARGIGFVIGMSIIGAICLAIWNEFLSITGIGQFIAKIIEEIHRNTPN